MKQCHIILLSSVKHIHFDVNNNTRLQPASLHSRGHSVCLCWQVMGHFVMAMLLLISRYRPTYPGHLKFKLVTSTSTLCFVKLRNTSHPLKTQWHPQVKLKPQVCVCSGWVSSSHELSEEAVTTHTRTHSDNLEQNHSNAEALMTHWTPTHSCHDTEAPTRESCCLLSDFTTSLNAPSIPSAAENTKSFSI